MRFQKYENMNTKYLHDLSSCSWFLDKDLENIQEDQQATIYLETRPGNHNYTII